MTTRWDLKGLDEAQALLDKAEHVEMDGPEADAFDYLVQAVDDGLWNKNMSHEALCLWCLCCELVERATGPVVPTQEKT